MSNIEAIVSSPRDKGNTGTLVNAILDGAMGLSTNIIKYYCLSNIRSYYGCDACGKCKAEGKCVQNDGLTDIIDNLAEADVAIFSTPVYFNGPSAQFKTLIDRMYSFYVQGDANPVKGKKAILVVSGSAPAGIVSSVGENIVAVLGSIGFDVYEIIVYSDEGGSKNAKDDHELLKRMNDIGLNLRNNKHNRIPSVLGAPIRGCSASLSRRRRCRGTRRQESRS